MTPSTPSPESEENVSQVIVRGGIRVDPTNQTVTISDRIVSLTAVEFTLLTLLIQNPEKCFTRAELLSLIHNEEVIVVERAVDVHICHLRNKLGAPEVIETVRKTGYRFRSSDSK